MGQLPLIYTSTRDHIHNLSLCPDPGLNLQYSGVREWHSNQLNHPARAFLLSSLPPPPSLPSIILPWEGKGSGKQRLIQSGDSKYWYNPFIFPKFSFLRLLWEKRTPWAPSSQFATTVLNSFSWFLVFILISLTTCLYATSWVFSFRH